MADGKTDAARWRVWKWLTVLSFLGGWTYVAIRSSIHVALNYSLNESDVYLFGRIITITNPPPNVVGNVWSIIQDVAAWASLTGGPLSVVAIVQNRGRRLLQLLAVAGMVGAALALLSLLFEARG
jgi:hypothetical protein